MPAWPPSATCHPFLVFVAAESGCPSTSQQLAATSPRGGRLCRARPRLSVPLSWHHFPHMAISLKWSWSSHGVSPLLLQPGGTTWLWTRPPRFRSSHFSHFSPTLSAFSWSWAVPSRISYVFGQSVPFPVTAWPVLFPPTCTEKLISILGGILDAWLLDAWFQWPPVVGRGCWYKMPVGGPWGDGGWEEIMVGLGLSSGLTVGCACSHSGAALTLRARLEARQYMWVYDCPLFSGNTCFKLSTKSKFCSLNVLWAVLFPGLPCRGAE